MARDYISIEGWVVDERTGEPLGSCYVYIEGTDYVALTDEDGTFIVRIPSIYHKDMLVAYQEGYERFYMPVSKLEGEDVIIKLRKTQLWDDAPDLEQSNFPDKRYVRFDYPAIRIRRKSRFYCTL